MNNKRIALVMPKSTFLEQSMVMQPLGLFYLAARLESLGYTTEFFDLNVDEFPADTFDEIWISATSPQMGEIKKIGETLKNYDARSVLGGAAVWANPESCKDLGYDLIVGGEADSPNGISVILNSEKDYEFIPVEKGLDWALPPVRRWSKKYKSALDDGTGNYVRARRMFVEEVWSTASWAPRTPNSIISRA